MEQNSHFQKTIAQLPELNDTMNERGDSWNSLTVIATIDIADRLF